jgi:hypothetical protein
MKEEGAYSPVSDKNRWETASEVLRMMNGVETSD